MKVYLCYYAKNTFLRANFSLVRKNIQTKNTLFVSVKYLGGGGGGLILEIFSNILNIKIQGGICSDLFRGSNIQQ